MVSPPANSSEVSSQSTLPSLRATKPSRLATMWIVTREWNGLASRDIDLRPEVERVARVHQWNGLASRDIDLRPEVERVARVHQPVFAIVSPIPPARRRTTNAHESELRLALNPQLCHR